MVTRSVRAVKSESELSESELFESCPMTSLNGIPVSSER